MCIRRNYEGTDMKRIIIAAGAALLTAVPATLGLIGNTSFAQNVPVRVPSQASVLNDDGTLRDAHATEPGDDKGGLTTHVEPGDDKGGLTTHVEPGDDKGSDSGAVKDDNGAVSYTHLRAHET